jgi:nucleoside-diphosphate-sugar epimerase/phosphoglycolate phosphatase-like HAD superfamily hydrolase
MKKKVLITGASGHIGRFVIHRLKNSYELYGISRNLKGDHSGVHWLQADLNDAKSVEAVKDTLEKMQVVVHLAAHVPHQKNEDTWEQALQHNVHATKRLLQYLPTNVRFINCSTAEVYGPQKYLPITEETLPKPVTHYGLTKLFVEQLLSQVAHTAPGFDLLHLRFATVYGPGENIKRATTAFIEEALTTKNITITGSGKDIRNYVYVTDAAEAVAQAIEFKGKFTDLNTNTLLIANEERLTLNQIAKTIALYTRASVKQKLAKESHHFYYNTTHAKKTIGFKAKVSFKEGILAEINQKRKILYLDLDGTLLDVSERLYTAHTAAATKYAVKTIPKQKYLDLKKNKTPEVDILGKKHSAEYDAHRISLLETPEYLAKDVLYPQAKNAIEKLKAAGYSTCLLTKRSDSKQLEKQLTTLGIAHLFDAIFVIDKSKHALGANLPKGTIVGDTEEDVQFAKKNGMLSIAASYGVRRRSHLEKTKPHFIVDTIEEILLILGERYG